MLSKKYSKIIIASSVFLIFGTTTVSGGYLFGNERELKQEQKAIKELRSKIDEWDAQERMWKRMYSSEESLPSSMQVEYSQLKSMRQLVIIQHNKLVLDYNVGRAKLEDSKLPSRIEAYAKSRDDLDLPYYIRYQDLAVKN
jgi:hypothetical protein